MHVPAKESSGKGIRLGLGLSFRSISIEDGEN
jgi:hypothetical protein